MGKRRYTGEKGKVRDTRGWGEEGKGVGWMLKRTYCIEGKS